MKKIMGFNEKEIKSLLSAVEEGQKNNEKIGDVFEKFGKKRNRAKGSVRNFYYNFLKKTKNNQQLSGRFSTCKTLKVSPIVRFEPENEKWLLKCVLMGLANKQSVRKTIFELACGDEKLALRYQNKYRNLVEKNRELVANVKEDLEKEGIVLKEKAIPDNMIKQLESGINQLVDNISKSIRKENEGLKSRVRELLKENNELKSRLEKYFEADGLLKDKKA